MDTWEIIYQYDDTSGNRHTYGTVIVQPVNQRQETGDKRQEIQKRVTLRAPMPFSQILGFMLLALGLGGIIGPFVPQIRLEAQYAYLKSEIRNPKSETILNLPKSVPVVFEPLTAPDGGTIEPASLEFGLIIPKVGINAVVYPGINPMNPNEYTQALKNGVAHAGTSFYPDEDGTVYLFSHSTNYDWFVKDLNAVFYLLKDLEKDDMIVIMYKNTRYTYNITDKKVVAPRSINYMVPYAGKRNLILQTCWPPGSTSERLLIFADLISDNGLQI